MSPRVVGLRGATTVQEDTAAAITEATEELLRALAARNGFRPAELASAVFTLTPDLRAAFPTRAAHRLGWDQVPMLCAQEIPVPGALPRVVRVLLHWNAPRPAAEAHHVYLRRATALRSDWAERGPAGRADVPQDRSHQEVT